jgi:hypothetical protein
MQNDGVFQNLKRLKRFIVSGYRSLYFEHINVHMFRQTYNCIAPLIFHIITKFKFKIICI